MTGVETLEQKWLNLGRQEREIEEAIAALSSRIKSLRGLGEEEPAEVLAEARFSLQSRLKQVRAEIAKIEPMYFALVNARRKHR